MRVLVCGGRTFGNIYDTVPDIQLHRLRNAQYKYMMQWLSLRFDGPRDDIIIIHGGAKGADLNAGTWAHLNHIPCLEYKASWKQYGHSAGYIRNKQMLVEGKPDLVIAFPGGKGTAMMVKLAKEAGVPVEIVPYP